MTDLLTGWKEIAQHLRVSEKTAMRYSKEKGLPVTKDPAGHPVMKKADADSWKTAEMSA
jgi:predicted site-specific integrase-resolvase